VPLEHYQLYLKLEVNTGYLLYNIIMQDGFTDQVKSQAQVTKRARFLEYMSPVEQSDCACILMPGLDYYATVCLVSSHISLTLLSFNEMSQ
jgi:hypothetical protein